MDYDRKSTVSSFYGGRKSTGPANNEYPPQPAAYAPSARLRDDASSFYQPERPSLDPLASSHVPSAGYNRGSFFNAGREEPVKGGRDEEKDAGDEAWDVYADFNNAGPRYSQAFGLGTSNNEGYSQLPPTPQTGPMVTEISAPSDGKVEMVTVPAMGAEWAKEELHHMTRKGKKERKKAVRRHFWGQWYRNERGLCGKYFTRRVLVWFLFALCIAIGLILAFTIPRVPSFSFQQDTPLVNATGSWATAVPTLFSRAPANFSFPAFASLEANTNNNFIPVHFDSMSAQVFDIQTDKLVGTAQIAGHTFPAKAFPRILLPLNFTYVTINDSDVTWANWYNACRNKAFSAPGRRPPLRIRLVLEMSIQGLIGSRLTSTSVQDADCPIELAQNAA